MCIASACSADVRCRAAQTWARMTAAFRSVWPDPASTGRRRAVPAACHFVLTSSGTFHDDLHPAEPRQRHVHGKPPAARFRSRAANPLPQPARQLSWAVACRLCSVSRPFVSNARERSVKRRFWHRLAVERDKAVYPVDFLIISVYGPTHLTA